MTKPITSVAAMILYEEGALSLLDPIAKFIPAFGNARVYRQGSVANIISAPAAETMLV
jgi:CubicO group peptidase (beta-lactamase class C family)